MIDTSQSHALHHTLHIIQTKEATLIAGWDGCKAPPSSITLLTTYFQHSLQQNDSIQQRRSEEEKKQIPAFQPIWFKEPWG
jgi:hypothetical protein